MHWHCRLSNCMHWHGSIPKNYKKYTQCISYVHNYGVNLFYSYSFCCIYHINFIITYSGIVDTLLVPATYEPLHKDGGAIIF